MICSLTIIENNYIENNLKYNSVDINLRNKLSKNYFMYIEDEFLKWTSENNNYFNKINNIEFIKYTENLLIILKKYKIDDIKYIFLLPYNFISIVDNNIIDELLLFVNYNEFEILNIGIGGSFIDKNKIQKIVFKNDKLEIYNVKITDINELKLNIFKKPYIVNIDFLIEILYNNNKIIKYNNCELLYCNKTIYLS